jgi:formylglycine-generating enzyme required for sulfatase activity
VFIFLHQFREAFSKRKSSTLIVFGMLLGFTLLLGGRAGVEYTSSDKYCDQACHSHPEATQTWIKSPHFSTKSGVVTHCTDCHLPAGGAEFYTEKARLGLQDIYGKTFKNVAKIDWQTKQSLEHAATFSYDSACVRCHQNLFSAGLSKKGVDGHLHYQRSQARMRCINCHLHTGHFRGKKEEATEDVAEKNDRELDRTFPGNPQGFSNYSEEIPGSEVKFRMVAVPGGTFQMGSPPNEAYRRPDEGPVHPVKLSPFWMGRVEVSWREYEVYLAQRGSKTRTRDSANPGAPDAVTGPTPPYGSPDQGWGRGARPAITMTHHAAEKYCEWLSVVTGKKYRLPTEAEWEYAARAGTTHPYFFDGDPARFTTRRWLNHILGVRISPLGDFAWYLQNAGSKTHPAEGTKPNPWGLLNMLGNVREFCLDWYAPDEYAAVAGEVLNPRGPAGGKEHVVRGGSYRSDGADLRCAARDHTRNDDWMLTDPQIPKSVWWYSDCSDVGFRLVREVDEKVEGPRGR